MKPAFKQQLGVSHDTGGKLPSLPDCLELVLRQSNSVIDAVLDGLARSVDPAQKLTRQVKYGPLGRAAIEELLDHRANVQQVFAEALRRDMYQGTGLDPYAQPLVRFDELQLLEEHQLDESIEIARAQQEVATMVDDVLPALDALMSTMLGWITVQAQINPLRPEVFVRALRESFLKHVKDPEVRGALIAPAAGLLGTGLHRLYKDVGYWLRSHGVEPAGVTLSSSLADKADRPGGLGNSVVRTLLTLDRLRRLLTGELDGDAADAMGKALGQNKDFLHTVPASVVALQDMQQVEAMVERLAKRARDPALANEADATRQARLRAMSDNKQMGQEIGQEVVRLMVDNLVQDERLMLPVRRLLQTLEPVLLKLAHADAQFFNDRQHPARLFLDKVIQRSLAYTTENDEEFYRFMRSAETAIAQLIEHSEHSAPPFVQMIEQLEKTWQLEDESLRQRREEGARALLHAEQRYLLAQKLAEEFREEMRGKEVPATVVSFLCGPWAQSVAEAQLSSPDGSSDPRGFRALVGELIWSVQPVVAKRNRNRLVRIVPGMLTKLREGLSLVEFPPELIASLFDELIAIHEAALDGVRPKHQPGEAPSAAADSDWDVFGPSSLPPELTEVWLGGKEAAGAGYIEPDSILPIEMLEDDTPSAGAEPVLAASAAPTSAAPAAAHAGHAMPLHTGSWVELMLEGKWTRVQLTWASPHRTLFMFTSRGGQAHSMSQRTMERLRTQGQMRVISDGHVVEHALDAVAEMALRNSLEQPKK
jgi:Protein of unknown function (DUF1631)